MVPQVRRWPGPEPGAQGTEPHGCCLGSNGLELELDLAKGVGKMFSHAMMSLGFALVAASFCCGAVAGLEGAVAEAELFLLGGLSAAAILVSLGRPTEA